MTSEISPEVESVNAEPSIAQDVNDIIGAIGNNPRLMIALTALSTFPEDTGGSIGQLNKRIRELPGYPPSKSKAEEVVLHSHVYERIFTPASLIERVGSYENGQKRRSSHAILSAKGRLALSVSGILFPTELNTPMEHFLETVYGTYAYIRRHNPRSSIYTRLLAGPASSQQLQEVSKLSRTHLGLLLKDLVDSGICESQRGPSGTRNAYKSVTLAPRFAGHIGMMMQGITLLCGEDKDAADFRQQAAERAGLIVTSPVYVNKLLKNSPRTPSTS